MSVAIPSAAPAQLEYARAMRERRARLWGVPPSRVMTRRPESFPGGDKEQKQEASGEEPVAAVVVPVEKPKKYQAEIDECEARLKAMVAAGNDDPKAREYVAKRLLVKPIVAACRATLGHGESSPYKTGRARWRHIASYLLKEYVGASYPEICRAIGYGDHTSPLHGYRSTVARMELAGVVRVKDWEAMLSALAAMPWPREAPVKRWRPRAPGYDMMLRDRNVAKFLRAAFSRDWIMGRLKLSESQYHNSRARIMAAGGPFADEYVKPKRPFAKSEVA